MDNAIVALMFSGTEKFPHQGTVLREAEVKVVHRCVALKNTV
jgi:hypothetical protein